MWGNKPIYSSLSTAKKISYNAQKQPLVQPGNIYAFGKYIFQVDVGRGIHIIDNTDPSKADRVAFISVPGCSQISIKGSHMYTNNIDDLVTLDISTIGTPREINRLKNAFPDFRHNYPLAEPEEIGYYVCPRSDSIVIGWQKDSIQSYCYKN